jgi:RNA polymerase sigma-70 factor (ECF subfamily)
MTVGMAKGYHYRYAGCTLTRIAIPATSMSDDTKQAFEQEFLEAYDLYADAIFRHCAYRLLDRERGSDLMQDTFMRAWEYLSKGEKVDNMRAFLYRVANNLIVDSVRKKKEMSLDKMMEEDGFEPGKDTTPDLHAKLEKDRIIEALTHLEETYREVLVLRYIDELPPAEIAQMLGVSANVVSVRIHRGLKQLRSVLQKHG